MLAPSYLSLLSLFLSCFFLSSISVSECYLFSLASLSSLPVPSFLNNTQLFISTRNFSNTNSNINISVTPARCLSEVEYLQRSSLASLANGNIYITNLGRSMSPIYVFSSLTSSFRSLDDNAGTLSFAPSLTGCLTFAHPLSALSSSSSSSSSSSVNNVILSPAFGIDMRVTPNAILIGNPNRGTQSTDTRFSVSYIEIVHYNSSRSPPSSSSASSSSPSSSLSPFLVSLSSSSSPVSYIVDWRDSSLGANFVCEEGGTQMAALTRAGVTVYKPIVGRSLPYANNHLLSSNQSSLPFQSFTPSSSSSSSSSSSDIDFRLPLPLSFTADSLALTSTLLAVSGTVSSTLSNRACEPAIMLFTLVDAMTNTWINVNQAPGAAGGNYILQPKRSNTDFDVNKLFGITYCADTLIRGKHLDIALSPDSSYVALGIPAWNTTFISLVDGLSSDTSDDYFTYLMSTVPGFGSQVALYQGGVLIVLGQNAVYVYDQTIFWDLGSTAIFPIYSNYTLLSTEYWLTLTIDVLPNRNLRPSGLLYDHRPIDAFTFTATASLIVVQFQFQSQAPGTELMSIPYTNPGMQYDYVLDEIVPCPRGRYSSNQSAAGFDGCQLCPLGTYQSSLGATSCLSCLLSPFNFSLSAHGPGSYCAVGSPSAYDGTLLRVVEADENGTFPDFEAREFRVAFEELLITTVFGSKLASGQEWAFIVTIILCAIVLALYLVLALQCLERVHPIAEFLLHQLQHLHRPEEGPGHTDLHPPHAHDEHGEHDEHDEHGEHAAAHAEHGSIATDHAPNTNSNIGAHAAHPPPLHSSPHANGDTHGTASASALSNHAVRSEILSLNHLYHKREAQLSGLFQLVFALFVVNALVYSITFYYNYQTGGPCVKQTAKDVCPPATTEEEESKINRYRYEALYSQTNSDAIAIAGLSALSLLEASLYFDMIGMSGFDCSIDTYQKGLVRVNLDGCYVLNSPLLCNDTSFIEVHEQEVEGAPFTCRIGVNLPPNSVLSATAVVSIFVPPSTNYVAMRLTYYQGGWFDRPQERVAYAAAQENVYAPYITMGKTHFVETMTHPNVTLAQFNAEFPNATAGNYIAPTITRAWNMGVLAWTYQIDNGVTDPVPYFYTFYNTISSASSPQFPIYSITDYKNDASIHLLFQLSLYSSTTYRRQTVEKLIQTSEALLTILLALIGIFHLVMAVKEFSEVLCYGVYAYQVKRVILTYSVKNHFQSSRKHHSGRHNQVRPVDKMNNMNMIASGFGIPNVPVDADADADAYADAERGQGNIGANMFLTAASSSSAANNSNAQGHGNVHGHDHVVELQQQHGQAQALAHRYHSEPANHPQKNDNINAQFQHPAQIPENE